MAKTFKEYPKMLYRDGEHLVVHDEAHAAKAADAGWKAAEELDGHPGETRPHAASAPDPAPYIPPAPEVMDRKALLAELTGAFAKFLSGREDEQLRAQVREMRAHNAKAAEPTPPEEPVAEFRVAEVARGEDDPGASADPTAAEEPVAEQPTPPEEPAEVADAPRARGRRSLIG